MYHMFDQTPFDDNEHQKAHKVHSKQLKKQHQVATSNWLESKTEKPMTKVST